MPSESELKVNNMLLHKYIKWTSRDQCHGCGDHAINKCQKYCTECMKWVKVSSEHQENIQAARRTKWT